MWTNAKVSMGPVKKEIEKEGKKKENTRYTDGLEHIHKAIHAFVVRLHQRSRLDVSLQWLSKYRAFAWFRSTRT